MTTMRAPFDFFSRRFPWIGLGLAVGGLWGCSTETDTPANVILVTLDTTRPDFLGAWGREGNPTPHLDALARDGVRFETAMTSSAVTPVSHASILSGRHQYQHGLRILAGAGGFQLPTDVPTLATTLKSRGYTTAAFHSAFPVSAVYGFDNGFDVFEDVTGSGLKSNDDGAVSWDVSAGQRRSDATTRLVKEFLASTDEPFFLWIHYWDPHDNFLLPPDDFIDGRLPLDAQGRVQWSSQAYGMEISYVDSQFGALVQTLKDNGQYDNTLLAVVADHGEGLEDGVAKHGWASHRILYAEQMHVPLILRIPGAESGRTVPNLVRSIDIYPTVLDYLDIAPEDELGGRSLRPLIEGTPEQPRIAYADQINLWDANAKMLQRRPQADFLHVIMDDEWKLIYRPRAPKTSELYAYRRDPHEQKNLFTRRIEVSKRLMEDLALRQPWVLEPPAASSEGMAASNMETLSKLGYVAGSVEMSSEAIADMWEWLCPEGWHRLPKPGSCPEHGAHLLPARKAAASSEQE